ncbi:hypothetical protein [Trinickia dabaoshanensis]|nr:hypothetical protein [Trinickia dabaoshanensis]
MRDVQGGTAKGRVRAYSETSRLAVIDVPIRDLVDAMNVGGIVETRSSCAGHRWPLLAALQAPFVMFKADCRYASRLSAAIHKDWCAAIHYLHYDWDITARFDDVGEFIFVLECRSRRFRRSRLERDFQTLKSWAEEIFRSGDRPDTFAAILSAAQGKQGAA